MSQYAPLDVVLAGVRVGESLDPRRCVVVGNDMGGNLFVMLCSSQMDLYRRDIDFLISDTHPKFPTAGFKHTSYVIEGPVIEVEPALVKKRYGRLEGDLAGSFLEWLHGIPGDCEGIGV